MTTITTEEQAHLRELWEHGRYGSAPPNIDDVKRLLSSIPTLLDALATSEHVNATMRAAIDRTLAYLVMSGEPDARNIMAELRAVLAMKDE